MKELQIVGRVCLAVGIATFAPGAYAAPTGRPVAMIREAIDEAKLSTLQGNTRPEATAENDRGLVADSVPLEHMLLQLQRSPEREGALKQYIEELHDAKSPNFHQWLTADQFALYYGVAKSDVDTVTTWLKSRGFLVNGVQASGLMVDFSGTAGQVRAAYHTEVHTLEVNGVTHFANMSDPKIPAALRPAVAGIVSLHNFLPKPQFVRKQLPKYTEPSGEHALVPGDIATIYNLAPLFAAGYSGKGQSIMVLEDTYVYSVNDWTIFRKTFGLTRPYPSGTFTQTSPSGALACTNPGVPATGDDGEAIIDAEWATAAAPNAAIILAACADTGRSNVTFGGLVALENVLNSSSLPSVVSMSYGEAEAANGAASNLAFNNAFQQAVTEGVSIFVSSGDEDAASADNGNVATHGIGISGFASTPYNVAVGGLDFGYSADFVNASTYWNANNSNTYSSALSYIQEIPWNGSCASSLLATFLGPAPGLGLTTTSDPLSLCNNPLVTTTGGELNFFFGAFGGSGGPSGCATGTASTRSVVSGTCAGYAKPSYQAGLVGNPTDGVRDIPDVALFASNGIFDAYYVVCWSNPNTASPVFGGFTCTGAPNTWAGFGGTSISSPIMAGIQALVNQKTGSRWGNPNTVYYSLANAEYGLSGSSTCNSTTVNKTSNSCIFYDVTEGDIVGVCGGNTLRNCYRPTENPAISFGLLSVTNTPDQPAYTTNIGWDFGSGIGSVNAYNLVMNWPIAP
jgi:subtilase family serine protease